MATAPDQGIMSLPQGEQAPPPQLSLNESYDAVQQGLQNASPDASMAVNQTLDQLAPMMDQLDDKTLDMLLQLIQYLMDHEKEYPQLIAQLAQKGAFPEGTFPAEYDPQFLSTFGMMIMHAQQGRGAAPEPSPEMTPPATMARGGIAEAARTVANQGRGQDTMLAHITPREAGILRAHGGMGTRNPTTGLSEFGFWDSVGDFFKGVGDAIGNVVKGVVNVVKDVVSSPIGKILGTVALATFLGPGAFGISGLGLGAAAMPLASAGITLLGGGDLKDALISGATAYFGAPGGVVSEFVGGFGGVMANGAVNAAVSAGLVGTGAGLLQGKSLADSVKSGLVAGAISGGMAALPSLTSEGVSLKEPGAGPNAQANGPTDASMIAETGVQPAPDASSLMTPTAPPEAVSSPVNPMNPGNTATLPPSDQIAPFTGAQSNALNTPSGLTPQYDSKAIQNAMAEGQQPDFAAPTGVAKPYTTPGMGESVGKMYEGATSGNLDTLKQGASDLFAPGMSAAQKDTAIQSYMDKGMSYTDAAKRVADQAPGMLRTYGPAVAAGLAGLALTGGFDVKQPQLSPAQQAMQDDIARERADLAANPGKWYSKDLKGVTYDSRGVPISSKPYDPSEGLPSSLVPSTGRSSFLPAVQQPYNAPAGYPDLSQYLYKPPAKKAMGGGIGSLATGGYPRKTGAIAGPGTATSDSIPAMLSDGEFVMTAKAVRGAGKGSRLAGAKKMYALMHQLERNASRS